MKNLHFFVNGLIYTGPGSAGGGSQVAGTARSGATDAPKAAGRGGPVCPPVGHGMGFQQQKWWLFQ